YKNTAADTDKAADSAAISAAGINSQISKLNTDLDGLKTLKNSVIADDNLFTDKYSVYALEFADYQTAVKAYDNDISVKTEELEKAKTLLKAGGISQSNYDSAKQSLKNVKLEKEKYSREFRLNIEQRIENAEKNISELEYSLQNQNKSYSAYSEINHDETLAKEQMRLEMLTSIADSIKSNEANIISIDKQIAEIDLSIKNSEVISPIDGTINMYSDLSEKDLVQSGQTVATVVPDTDGAYKLTMYLSSADISETEVGQNVRLRFAAYPYQEYGELSGTVKSISTDVRSSDNGASYYVAEVSIDDTMGLELVSGMECEARVVTKQRKIMYWLLEKLDFIDD
ncbi:MAG: HlyD family secretion protein, partial [Oscillospiraceae bacterium]|nr:HlyD family secretion protein [Oscillospiraceae bacterium]